MKRITALFLGIVLLFSLSACAQLDAIKNTELPPLPSAESDPSPAPSQNAGIGQTGDPLRDDSQDLSGLSSLSNGAELGHRITIYSSKTKELSYAPDNQDLVILTFSYVTPTVRIDGCPDAAEKINEQLRILDEIYYSGSGNDGGKNHLEEAALDNYLYATAKGADVNLSFTSARTVRCCRADGSVISLLYYTNVYTGGSSGIESYLPCSFDPESGEKLSLEMLSDDPVSFRASLEDLLVRTAGEYDGLYDRIAVNGADADAAVRAVIREDNWFFSQEGLVFYSECGELLPESDGILMLTIPYAALRGLIADRFLPAARETVGTLEAVRISDVPDGSIGTIDDLLIISEGEEICLKVTGTIYDVCVTRIAYADQGERFYETDRPWYTSYMTDCALQINTTIPEGMPNLMITYTDDTFATHRFLLSENGIDGSVILVDDTIEAVG